MQESGVERAFNYDEVKRNFNGDENNAHNSGSGSAARRGQEAYPKMRAFTNSTQRMQGLVGLIYT